jgi:hypothetical protein
MGNKHSAKLGQADLDYLRHMTTFSDTEIRICTNFFSIKSLFFFSLFDRNLV